jgi:hypothetical protein
MYLRKSCWKTYVGVRERKLQEKGENYVMRSLMNYTPPDIIRAMKPRRMRW